MIVAFKNALTLYVIFPTILLVGGYLSYRLRFLQITHLFQAFHLIKTQKKRGGISSFNAVAAILGGNLGTGNISGIAVALTTGGPGALFWMWVMAVLASILKFAGCFLGVAYREKDAAGEWVGGPMYYLSKGLKKPFLAKLFCFLTLFSALTVGNMVQVNSLVLPLEKMGISPFYVGVGLACLVGGVIWGGLQRFATVVSLVVPFMAFSYILICLVILSLFYTQVPVVLKLIWHAAFALEPLTGGALGYTLFQAIRTGFDRGLFATDSGLGLAPILHSAVTDFHETLDNKLIQGIVSILSPMIVMIVCTMTGTVLLVTGVWKNPDLYSTNMCIEAFRVGLGHPSAGHVITVTLFFFAFTTILTWSFCGDKAIEFLYGKGKIRLFQIFFIGLIPFGGSLSNQTLWMISDLSINGMFIVNMVGVIGLAPHVIRFTQSYFKSR